MKKILLFTKIFLVYFLLNLNSLASESDYFAKGLELFNKNEFDKSKILFEKDIVFNPKSEKSYLYLAKIFSKKENKEEQEINLNNVLLINPKNDEAIYMLTLIKIEESDYDHAKKLIKKFELVCKSFCSKKNEIIEKFEKLTPENE